MNHAHRGSPFGIKKVVVPLVLLISLSAYFVLPTWTQDAAAYISLTREDGRYLFIENQYYKVRISGETSPDEEPSGLIDELYVKRTDGSLSRNIVCSDLSSEYRAYRLGYIEKAATYDGHYGGITHWPVEFNITELDSNHDGLIDTIIVEAVGKKSGYIAGERTYAENKNLWVFWADKPYFYGRHEKFYSDYDYGWNDQIAWMYDMAVGGRLPSIYMTKENGTDVHLPYQSQLHETSRIFLPVLLEKRHKLPYIALESADGIVASLIMLNASTPLLEMVIHASSDLPFQEPEATFFSSQDYMRGSLELAGKTEYIEVIYYNIFGTVNDVDNLARELYSSGYVEEEILNDVRVGSCYYVRSLEPDRWIGTSLYGPYHGYSSTSKPWLPDPFETSPQLDYPNFASAHFMSDHFWAREWFDLNGRRFERLGVRSGYDGRMAWTEDYYYLGQSALAVRHTLYRDSDKMVVEVDGGIGGGGTLFREDFEDMDLKFFYYGSQYFRIPPDSWLSVQNYSSQYPDRGNVLDIDCKAYAHIGSITSSFNASFYIQFFNAEGTVNDFFGLAGENTILRLRNEYGELKASTSGGGFVDTGVSIRSGEWFKFTVSVDSTHYSLFHNDQFVGKYARESTETPSRILLSGLGSRCAFDDIILVSTSQRVSVKDLVYKLKYNPGLENLGVVRLNATTFDIRFDDPMLGERIGITVMANGVASVVDDGKALYIRLIDNSAPVEYTNKAVNATVIIWSHLGEIDDVSKITALHDRRPLVVKRHYVNLPPLAGIPRDPSKITVSDPQPIVIGENITITGSLVPKRPGLPVTLTYSRPDGTTYTQEVITDETSSFRHTFTPEQHGNWTVTASWEGDFDYLPYQSPPVAFIVKGLSSITYSVSQPITIGEEITVSGTIEPARSGATVTLAYTQPDGTPVTREVITDASGNFSDTIPSDQHGNWTVTASWEGDLYYTGSQSPSTTFIVKGLTSITCSVSAETLWLGENIAVSGSIIPPRANVVVELRYTREDGSFVTRTATTDDSGAFRDAFEPDAIDSWNVSASWNGDPYFVGASSSTASFLVRSYWFEITVPRILLTIVIAAVFLFAIPFPYLRRKAKIKEEKRKAKKVKRKAKIRTKKKRK